MEVKQVKPEAEIDLEKDGNYIAGGAEQDIIELKGKVVDKMSNAMFSVEVEGGHVILARISAKMRETYVKLNPGDTVTVQLNPYDLTRGRITWKG